METRLFEIRINNVSGPYLLGRIIGELDIVANLAEDRHERGYCLCEISDDIWLYKIRSQKDILAGVINEIKKWISIPDVSIEFIEVEES